MKLIFKNITLLVVSLFLLSGCTKDFDTINNNPNSPVNVNSQLLLPDIQRDMFDRQISEAWGIGNIVIQHIAKNQFVNEDRYLWGERNGYWNTIYDKMRDVENYLSTARANNDKGSESVGLIMKSWMYSILTDTYGDVPYTEAVKAKEGIFYPKYDEQEKIYQGILDDLKKANEYLATEKSTVAGDLIFAGNPEKWRKTANALRIRYLMRISRRVDVKNELTAIISDPVANPVFTGNEDNAVYNYTSTPPDIFPMYYTRVGSFNEYRASKTLMDMLKGWDDPRYRIFFRPTPASEVEGDPEYIGIPNGLDDVEAQTYEGGQQNHSPVGRLFFEESNTAAGMAIAKGVMMTYAELMFCLAEAAEKGFVSGSAEEFYLNGIKASFDYYSLDLPNGYLDIPAVKFTGDMQQKLVKIGTQKWISLFFQGSEAWFDWRRTRIPNLNPSRTNQNNDMIPVRFIYPIGEQALNGLNRQAAVDRMGGDDLNTLMWYLK